jgi:hypothetical protein
VRGSLFYVPLSAARLDADAQLRLPAAVRQFFAERLAVEPPPVDDAQLRLPVVVRQLFAERPAPEPLPVDDAQLRLRVVVRQLFAERLVAEPPPFDDVPLPLRAVVLLPFVERLVVPLPVYAGQLLLRAAVLQLVAGQLVAGQLVAGQPLAGAGPLQPLFAVQPPFVALLRLPDASLPALSGLQLGAAALTAEPDYLAAVSVSVARVAQ